MIVYIALLLILTRSTRVTQGITLENLLSCSSILCKLYYSKKSLQKFVNVANYTCNCENTKLFLSVHVSNVIRS